MEYRSNKQKVDSDSDLSNSETDSDSTNHKAATTSTTGGGAARWDRTKISTNREKDDDDDGPPPAMEFAFSRSKFAAVSRQSVLVANSSQSKRASTGGGGTDGDSSVAMATAVSTTNGDAANGGHVIKKRKINSVWADVIAEQQLTQRISSGSNFTMKDRRRATLVRRGPESYDRKRPLSPGDDGDDESRDQHDSIVMETESKVGKDNPFSLDNKKNRQKKFDGDDRMMKRCGSSQSLNGENRRNGRRSRQNSAATTTTTTNSRDKNHHRKFDNKNRNNRQQQKFTPKPMKFDVEFDKIAEEKNLSSEKNLENFVKRLADALTEPKIDLIDRCVKNLGVEKSIDFFDQTKSIELAGGRMTLDKSRRRSPGGVFLELIRLDATIDDETKSKIFERD